MKEIVQLKQEKQSSQDELERLNVLLASLEIQKNEAQAEASRYRHLPSELDQLKQSLQDAKVQNSELTEVKNRNDQELQALRLSLEDATQSLKHMYKERDLLKNTITGLISEIEALKSQVPQQHTFVDFVQLKREYISLKDEHQRLLKRKGSKPNLLPTLKPEHPRVSSGESTRSKASLRS